LADCQIYLKIWEKLEEIVIDELESKIFDRWKLSTSRQELKATLLGSRLEDKLAKRKLHIRGLTSTSLITEMKEILGSGTKASKAVCWFTKLFWSNFYERLWKFRCEVMIDWEKRNGINLQVKKKKLKRKYKDKQNNRLGNKENIGVAEGERKESIKE